MTFGLGGVRSSVKGKNQGPVPVPEVHTRQEGWEPVAGG